MKKLFLFLAITAIAFTSCSKDDDSSPSTPTGTITMTVDGVTKTFNSIIVEEEDTDGGYLIVTATIGTSTNDIITFSTYKGDVGSNAINDVVYTKNSVNYYSGGFLTTNVTKNSGNKLNANFSGYLGTGEDTLEITNGSITISY